MRILTVFGTRPEAIKMAPLVKALQACPWADLKVCITAQHRDMLDGVLETFGIVPDFDLDIMTVNQTLAGITTKALNGLVDVMADFKPSLVLAHGDTTTTMAASLAAFYSGASLGHVEAGLRTYDKHAPFPEEVNRRIAGVIADIHFAPTAAAKDNLLAENTPEATIFVTGNTAIDAIGSFVRDDYTFKEDALNKLDLKDKKVITMTAHRRENYGEPLENICHAVVNIVRDFDDVLVVYPVHPSPVVKETAEGILGGKKGIHLINPLDIEDMHNLIARSYMVLTDSGGLQEEAPHHNVPVVVLRETTERPEGLVAGCLTLAGNERATIYDAVSKLLQDKETHSNMCNAKNPFGDGLASHRIVQAIEYHFGLTKVKPKEFL
ncbi:MAG: UDP-N-acetylglucosamine 2-epimerase (non-hydrolyzing) [Defluviitaleaceae bacterium]|nr:UDP-N-acetylglucosamine 2-epimerase (non-hydrolyzing) [Defluviitaleaceae bacterium]